MIVFCCCKYIHNKKTINWRRDSADLVEVWMGGSTCQLSVKIKAIDQ